MQEYDDINKIANELTEDIDTNNGLANEGPPKSDNKWYSAELKPSTCNPFPDRDSWHNQDRHFDLRTDLQTDLLTGPRATLKAKSSTLLEIQKAKSAALLETGNYRIIPITKPQPTPTPTQASTPVETTIPKLSGKRHLEI